MVAGGSGPPSSTLPVLLPTAQDLVGTMTQPGSFPSDAAAEGVPPDPGEALGVVCWITSMVGIMLESEEAVGVREKT